MRRWTRIIVPVVAVMGILCSAPSVAQQAAQGGNRRHVLILNSYHRGFPWTDNQVAGAEEILRAQVDNLELYVEYMDTKRIYEEAYLAQLALTFRCKYSRTHLDAIIATDDNALHFVLEHHDEIFHGAPVAFCGINDLPSFALAGKEGFTGLVEVLDVKDTLDLALRLHPGTRRVVVDNTPTGMGQRKEVAAASGRYGDVEFEYLQGEDYSTPELLAKLQQLPADSVVLLTVWLRDKNNKYAAVEEVGPMISSRSSVPVYGIIDMYLGRGIVGGKLLDSETHGRLAAERVVRILAGERPADIPVLVESSNPYMFDEAQLRRWGIKMSDLPEESVVINRSFSLYEAFRAQIWSIVAAFVLLVVVIVVLVGSIMRRRQAEQALRDSQTLLNESQAIAHVGSWELDVITNRLTWSDEVYRMFGLEPGKCAPSYDTFLDAVHPDDRVRVDAAYSESRRAGDDTYEIEHRIIRQDNGEVRTLHEKCVHLRDASRKVVRSIGMVQDITERRRGEIERQELEAQLRQSQKLEAVGQLAGGVAHDFNNLLTAILGNVELSMDSVRRELTLDHDVIQSLEQIEQAAQRASALTRQLLTFSRRDITQPKVLDLNSILANLDKMLRRLITENITLKTSIDAKLQPVRIDAGQLEQVIVNLAVNAADAMRNGGTLTLETRNVLIDEEYARDHVGVQPGPHVLLAVSDTGHGMDSATCERVFEPFFTTKPVGKGTGLGLATVHGIAKQAGGHVTVYSEVGRGTTFKVYFPAVVAVVVDDPPVSAPDMPPGGYGNVLLCEDDQSVRELVARSLQSAGYTVVTARNGQEGLNAVERHAGPIDLLITDVIMPDMNGRALAERVRAIHPDMPTLFISGYTSNVIAHHGVLDKGVEFLEKPFTRQRLLTKVCAVLGETRTDVQF